MKQMKFNTIAETKNPQNAITIMMKSAKELALAKLVKKTKMKILRLKFAK